MYFPHWGIVKRPIGKKLWQVLSAEMGQERESKDGLDFGVEGDVCGGDAVDGEFLAGGFGEMEKAADMVVLVVAGEKPFGFRSRELKRGEGDRGAEGSGERAVAADKFAQWHNRCAAGSFTRHGSLVPSRATSLESVHRKSGVPQSRSGRRGLGPVSPSLANLHSPRLGDTFLLLPALPSQTTSWPNRFRAGGTFNLWRVAACVIPLSTFAPYSRLTS